MILEKMIFTRITVRTLIVTSLGVIILLDGYRAAPQDEVGTITPAVTAEGGVIYSAEDKIINDDTIIEAKILDQNIQLELDEQDTKDKTIIKRCGKCGKRGKKGKGKGVAVVAVPVVVIPVPIKRGGGGGCKGNCGHKPPNPCGGGGCGGGCGGGGCHSGGGGGSFSYASASSSAISYGG